MSGIVCVIYAFAAASLSAAYPKQDACQRISFQFPGAISYPESTIYDSSNSYYSGQERDFSPGCIFRPTCTQEVADFVKSVTKYNDTQFAIRTGGHTLWTGAAKINGGITVNMRLINEKNLNDNRETAYLGGGGLYNHVYPQLEEYNLTVMGGVFQASVLVVLPPEFNNGGDKTSSWSQEWSVVQDEEALTDVYQEHQASITAGAAPVSSTGPAPITVPNALFNTASSGTTVSITTTSNSIAPTETATGKTDNTKTNEAWIAGPVIGGIAAICLFFLGVFLYQRRRRRRIAALPELEGDTFQRTGDKPQLHSDHLPPRIVHEMDASHAPCEADDGAAPEMAANEVPQELEADHHHLRPSEDGIDVVNRVVTTG